MRPLTAFSLVVALTLALCFVALAKDPPPPIDDDPVALVEVSGGDSIELDLDSDGHGDDIRLLEKDGDTQQLEVVLASRYNQVRFGGGSGPLVLRFYGEDGEEKYEDDFSWVVAWQVLPLEDGHYEQDGFPIGNVKWHVPDAEGDGLWMTSEDAAAVLYKTENGWVLMHLGY